MNAAKFTLTSTILAAALGLAFGLAAAPALADQPVGGVHGHGGDNGDKLASPLDVILDELISPIDDALLCMGTTAPPSVLATDFRPGCIIKMKPIPELGGPDLELSLFSLHYLSKIRRHALSPFVKAP